MKKLSLDLDQLVVDSFDTSARPAQKGTVFGEQCTCPSACTCPGCPTCDTCQESQCGPESCDGTCGTYEWTCGSCYPCTDSYQPQTCNPTYGGKDCCPL